MPSYKLTYFDGRGRGEPCRLLFVLAGREFQDVRIPFQDWPKYKSSTPYGQLSMLEIDGKVYSQSNALATYLAKEFGYYGQTNLEHLLIDQVVCLVYDFVMELYKFFFEKDEVKKAELKKHFVDVEVPRFLGLFENLLAESGTGYFVGGSVSLADVVVYEFVSSLEALTSLDFLQGFPRVQQLLVKFENIDSIKAYIANKRIASF